MTEPDIELPPVVGIYQTNETFLRPYVALIAKAEFCIGQLLQLYATFAGGQRYKLEVLGSLSAQRSTRIDRVERADINRQWILGPDGACRCSGTRGCDRRDACASEGPQRHSINSLRGLVLKLNVPSVQKRSHQGVRLDGDAEKVELVSYQSVSRLHRQGEVCIRAFAEAIGHGHARRPDVEDLRETHALSKDCHLAGFQPWKAFLVEFKAVRATQEQRS
mmetsp:Transcript_45418/g.97086  ORF Transcript_45418/g.97086 Transcript_45418/m.97086 type:complete len:220 (-) Transcript_45418:883-1542(-)